MTTPPHRTGTVERRTTETSATLSLSLDEPGDVSVQTGIGFLDHLLTSLACHAGWSLQIAVAGDLHVDDHHTAEDTAIALGMALDQALGSRNGLTRFGHAFAPLDESLARAVVDLATRPHARCDLGLQRETIGALSCENIPHVLTTFVISARMTAHVDVIVGANDHHRAEAAFKALALALKQAVVITGESVRSTKGVL